jgi:beta-phosphoglucomutase-like phosphatase (HAD superfamily)
MPLNIDLVIFDCDGVLVDSEVIAYRIFAECLNKAGITLSMDEAMAFGVGKSATTLGGPRRGSDRPRRPPQPAPPYSGPDSSRYTSARSAI